MQKGLITMVCILYALVAKRNYCIKQRQNIQLRKTLLYYMYSLIIANHVNSLVNIYASNDIVKYKKNNMKARYFTDMTNTILLTDTQRSIKMNDQEGINKQQLTNALV